MSADATPAHWAEAAEVVTGGPQTERDVVERVAQAIADAEARGYDNGCRDSLGGVDSEAR